MAVDLFEDLVRGFLQTYGYLTIENVAYKPVDWAQTGSDIDIVAFHHRGGPFGSAVAVNCKGGRDGLRLCSPEPASEFRELVDPRWGAAFVKRVRDVTGRRRFTHLAAVSKADGALLDRWTGNADYKRCIAGIGSPSALHGNALPHRWGRLFALCA